MSDGRFKGWFELNRPSDLVKKLAHDFGRLERSPQDQYAAFDFFVTAEHIVDWIHPKDRAAREALRSSHALLRITSHLANGGKHFQATRPHHKSIAGAEKERYVEAGYVEEGYVAEPLVVHLTKEEATEVGGTTIEAVALARKVLEYWSANVPAA